MSRLFDIVDAIVTELNAGTWSQAFTAEKVLVWEEDLHDRQAQPELKVMVRGVSVEQVQLTRGKSIPKVTIEIAVTKRLGSIAPADVDPFLDLVDEIREAFDHVHLAEIAAAFVEASQSEPSYDEAILAQRRRFFGVVELAVVDYS
ncbi:MAG: hypothetical protein KDE27_20435 [Planctomycetes bacterium]|nr:hypothetical protein [Planctomycetota bacterium]